jgi:uncharacterized protein YndB with AHSA1/START domain
LQPFSCYLVEAAMGFADRIERTVQLACPPRVAWAALTTAEGLATFDGTEPAIDLRPGGGLTAHLDAA